MDEKGREMENSWLTYFTCQGGTGMLIHVVTVHNYTYGYIHHCVYTVHSVSVCVCMWGIILRRNSSPHHSL